MSNIIAIIVIVVLFCVMRERRKARARLWFLSDRIDEELNSRRILSINPFRTKRNKGVVSDQALIDSMIDRFESLNHDKPYDDKEGTKQ